MNAILRHLEIIFTLAGIAVVFLVTALFRGGTANLWEVAAITATLVGVIHGLLFWLVRRRQREVRRAAIAELQWMLQDIVNNQLAVIQAMADLREATPAEAKRASAYIAKSVGTISEALRHLSEESLRNWRSRYDTRADGRGENS